jgi:ABC-type glycerol-3-phosphate transport system permease component
MVSLSFKDIGDVAFVDGASRLATIRRITLPLAAPGWSRSACTSS